MHHPPPKLGAAAGRAVSDSGSVGGGGSPMAPGGGGGADASIEHEDEVQRALIAGVGGQGVCGVCEGADACTGGSVDLSGRR